MAVDSARWIVKLDYMETPIPVDGLWEYFAHGDTLVAGTLYMKIYKRNLAEGRLIHKAIPANNPYVLNAESLVSGLYLIRMWDGKVWQSGKVIRE